MDFWQKKSDQDLGGDVLAAMGGYLDTRATEVPRLRVSHFHLNRSWKLNLCRGFSQKTTIVGLLK